FSQSWPIGSMNPTTRSATALPEEPIALPTTRPAMRPMTTRLTRIGPEWLTLLRCFAAGGGFGGTRTGLGAPSPLLGLCLGASCGAGAAFGGRAFPSRSRPLLCGRALWRRGRRFGLGDLFDHRLLGGSGGCRRGRHLRRARRD